MAELIKPFWKSKTVLVNVIGATVLYFLGLEEVAANGEIVALSAASINLILRFLTNSAISVTGNR